MTGSRRRRICGFARTVASLACWLSVFVVTCAGNEPPQPETGKVSGVVVNVSNGAFLSRTTVEVLSLGVQVETDLDGLYTIELPVGQYRLGIRHKGFVEQVVEYVRVEAGVVTYQDIALNPEGMTLGEVTVVAESSQVSAEALLAERKGSASVSDSIGAQEMSRLTGSAAADVISRVTGVLVVDDRYVYIRGLGERYSNTMLNGAVLPSPQPDKKIIPLDMFPANLLENIQTEKSYTPDKPGDFSGGVVNLRTVDFPRQGTLRASYGQGFGTNTTFKDFLDYPGGSLDWLGFDDGSRALPGGIPSEKLIRRSRFSSTGFSPEELESFGQSFSNVWSPSSESAIPNQNVNLVAGNTFGQWGMVFALSQSNKFHNQTEKQNYFKVGSGGGVEPFHNYDFSISERSVRSSFTGNLAYELSKSQRLIFRNFYSKDTSDEARYFEGFNGDAGNEVRDTRLRFVEEGLYSGQFGGEHMLSFLGNSFLEWKLTYSGSSLNEPDLREVLYEKRGNEFVLADESQSGFRMYNDLGEDLWQPSVDITSYFHRGGINGSAKFGISYSSRNRTFDSRRFRFTSRNTSGIDLTASPEEIFSPANIGPDGFEIREETRPTDSYVADQINRSAYGMVDISLRQWRLIGGLRIESDGQLVETFDPFDRDNPSRTSSELRNTDAFPMAGVIYRVRSDMNLRASFSQTVNRPQFRELSPFEFTDVVGGRAVVGNPELKRSSIQNYDLRWEWFVGPVELISLSYFHKNFDDPIERFIRPTAQLQTSYLNAEGARNSGLEIDLRKKLGFLSDNLERFSVAANYTLVDSEVQIPDEVLNVLTSLNRPLEGQSRHVLNGMLEFEEPGSGSIARLLLNYQGERITDVGALGLPDIYQSGYPNLDAVFIQPFAGSWGLKVSAENLLDRRHEYTQGNQIQRTYKTGRFFSITISKNFLAE